MDVRQLDFLAAQPSAELKPRETFCGISKRALALLLVNALFWQPIWAQADGIAVSNGNGARLDQAGNGVPIVNIATPGANGLSHNQFQDYNVDSRGVILNNVTDRTGNTQLGGIIVGNPNLQGRAAGVILNEVVGGSPSQLKGYTEVAGQAARVIVANPYGITCNGCGFINTPRVTLTTGKPILDGNRLDHFQVDGGSVSLEGNGLNADNVDQFDIVTRSAKLNAELHARQLNVIAGRNDVAADSLAATPRTASPGDAPQLAIDSSALGGMYANTIRLVGTEAGVGVRLAGNLAASAGDIQLDANGQLTLAQTAASGNIALKGQGLDAQGPLYAGGSVNAQSGGDLQVRQSVAAGNAITLSAAGQLTNGGIVEAGVNPDNSRNAAGDVSLQGAHISNRGSVIASRTLTATTAGTLDNSGSTLSAGSQARLAAASVGNAQGRIQSRGSLNVQATTLDNTQGVVTSVGALTANLGQTTNGNGELSSQDRLSLQGQGLDNRQGKLIGTTGLDLTLTGTLDNRGGNLVSHGDLQARVTGTLDNRQQGNLYGAGASVLSFDQLLNAQGVLASDATLTLTGNQVNNDGGQLGSQGNLTATLGRFDQLDGQFISQGQLTLIADRLGNTGNALVAGKTGLELRVGAIDNRGGEASSQSGNVSLTGQSLLNSGGKVIAGGDLTATMDTVDNSTSGVLSARQGLRVTGANLNNSAAGVLNAGGDLQVTLSGALNNALGKLLAQGGLTLGSASLDNRQGLVSSVGQQTLTVTGGTVQNEGGRVVTDAGLSLTSARLNNGSGTLSAKQALSLTTGVLDNTLGRIVGQSSLDLTATGLDNRQGLVSSVGQQTLIVTGGAVQNDKGQLVTDGGLTLSSASLDNGTGTLSAKGATTLTTTGAITNAQGGRLVGSDRFTVTAGSLTNAGRLASTKDLVVTTASLTNSGELFSQAGLTLDLKNGTLTNNAGGLITAPGALLLKNLNTVRNAGEISSGQAFTLAANSLDNSGGKLISNADLTLRITRALANAKGTLSAAGLDVQAASLDNSAGLLTSRQGQRVTLTGAQADGEGLLLNDQGELLSEGTMDLTAADLDNRQGLISSAGQQTVTVTGGAVQNEGGQLVTDGGLTLSSASLANGSGTLSAKGAVSLTTTGTLDNAQTGRLIGSDTVTVTAGSLSNAGRLASAKDLAVTTASLTNSGELFSQAGLTLDLKNGSLTNTGGGLITAPGTLLLKNLNSVRNAGELSSGKAFTLMADSLDNSGGKLISNAGLTLRIAQALTNAKGALSAAGLDVEAASLDNSTGLLTSRQGLSVTLTGKRVDGQGLLLNDQGQLLSDGTLDLTAADLDNRQGLVSSAGQQTLTVTGGAVQNGGGQLVADGGLSLSGASLANAAGTLSAKGAVTLTTGVLDNSQKGRLVGGDTVTVTAQRLDNSSGLVSSAKALHLTLTGALTNAGGQLLGEDTLGVNAGSLDNRQGTVSSAGQQTLTVTGGAVQNDKGQLVTDGGLTLSSTSLDNGTGTLSAKGAVTLTTTGALSNAQQGALVGSDSLTVTAGSLNNAGRLASAKDLAVTTATLTNSGELFSQAGLTLDLKNGTLTNSAGGLITAPGALLLNNLNTVRNAGELSSGQALTLTADSLDNSGGKLISNADLTLRITRALTNAKGTLSAAGLDLKAASLANQGGTLVSRGALDVTTTTGLLDNSADGLLSAATTLDVTADTLDNAGGSLLAKGATTVTAGQLDNSANGLINSQATLTLTADRLDSSNGGEVSAKGDVQLTLGEFKQQGGRLIGEAAIGLDLGRAGGTGNLDNTGGLITTTGLLSFARLKDVTNTAGEIGSSQTFTLIAQGLDNTRGKLISQGLLKVQASTLTNNGGLLSGWQGLTVTGGTLSNRQSGTLSSKAGDLTATLTGTLDNGDNGALVSQKALTVTAANLANTGGVLSSGTAQTLTVTGTLQNDALQNGPKGLIDAGTTLSISAGHFANTGGTAQAQGALTLNGGSLDNSGGTLSGQQAVTLDLVGALTNTSGAVLAKGDLLIKNATAVSNAHGRLNSGGLLTLLVGGLDNSSGGTVAGQTGLSLTTSGRVLNGGDGLLASQDGALNVTAGSLDNAGGTLQSAGDLTLATGTGDISNVGGKVIAQNGDLHITGANLDSRGGTLASLQGAFIAGINGLLKNGGQGQTGGTIQAQRLDLTAATLDNYNGKVSALGGNALLKTGSVDNRNGSLYGKGLVQVRGGSFDNSGDNDGQVFGSQIDFGLSGALNNRLGIIESSSTLSLAAASLDNTNGQLRALGTSGTTQLTLGGWLDNTNGRLETANQDLQLAIGGLTNTNGTLLHVGAGTFGLGLPLLQNAGGSVTSNGTLTLNGSSWTNSSTLQVANLAVNVDNLTQTGSGQLLASNNFTGTGSNWTNDGLIAAGGNLSLTLGGTYQGAGRLSSGNDFTLGAGQVLLDNPNARLTAGSGTTTFNIGGLLRNQARITSAGNFTLNAGQVVNQGTLGASGNLTINTPSLTNQNSSLIFSGGDMAFGVNDFTNRYADVYSLGRLLVARDSSATQRASRFKNISATMESAGDMTLRVDEIINRKDILNYSEQFISGDIAYECLNCKGRHYDLYYYVTQKLKRVISADSRSASLLSGGGLQADSNNFSNKYSVISASRDIDIRTGNFENTGAADSVVERFLQYRNPDDSESKDVFYSLIGEGGAVNEYNKYMAERKHRYLETVRLGGRDGGTETRFLNRNEQVVNESNPDYSPSRQVALPGIFSTYTQVDSRETVTSTGASAMAVVQAGGSVRIEASQNLSNGLVQQGIGVQRGGNRTQNTQVPGVAVQTTVTFNSQLPPDLAQQQVNPTTLPGFSLPTGQNGLFRLSNQQGGEAELKTVTQTEGVRSTQVATVDKAAIQIAKYTAGRSGDAIQQVLSTQTGNVSPLRAEKVVGTTAMPNQLAGDAISVASASSEAAMYSPIAVVGKMSDDRLAKGTGGEIAARGIEPSETLVALPSTVGSYLPHRYLVETNPALTDLKQFMSSDYLLDNLNYNPDTSWKRLGDGLYEQRLIQQAIVQRTGQRFIAGLSSDEAQFKYLMDNALQSKQALGLSVGVSLTAEQVAALTHDIVWMEDQIVNGEHVLVPVLYLANANNRLAPNGALIQGSDVTLIAGNDLTNAGTLRATNNLTATATNNLVNSGLIQSGDRLSLTSTTGDISNRAGGIIAGRDVSLDATRGDILNERTLTTHTASYEGRSLRQDYVDNAARIEAANDLTLSAGRDISNIGGALSSGRDLTLQAGRDLKISSVEAENRTAYGSNYLVSTTNQLAGTVQAGRDLSLESTRNIEVTASNLSAGRDASLYTYEGDITLTSAANRSDSIARSKKTGTETHNVTQQSATLVAGRDVSIDSGRDLGVIGSSVKAGADVILNAVQDTTIAAAKDESSYSYFKKKKGSFGKRSITEQGSYDSTNVASVIEAGNDLTINASKADDGSISLDGGRNVTVIGSQLRSGNDLLLGATQDVNILSGSEEHGAYSKKTKSGSFGLSKSGKTALETSTTQISSELEAGQDTVIVAGNDVKVRGSNVSAGRDAELRAGVVTETGDVTLGSTSDSQYTYNEQYKKKFGLSFSDAMGLAIGAPSWGGDLTLNSGKKAGQESTSASSVGSYISAERDVTLKAQRDVNVVGSGVSAGRTATLSAGRDVNVLADTDAQSSSQWQTRKTYGLKQTVDSNAYTTFVGNETIKDKTTNYGLTAAASQIDAGLDINIAAKRDVLVQGADLYADNDINLKAQRNVRIEAAGERNETTTSHSQSRTGTTTSVNYNFGNTVDAVRGVGQGENTVSQVSGGLRAVDAVGQYLAGPTFDGQAGSNRQGQTVTQISQSARGSSFSAGNDINVVADNDVSVIGGQFQAGRDINVKGRDVVFDVARGVDTSESQQDQRKSGFKGGTSGGFKVGYGVGVGTANQDSSQGTSSATQLDAGRNINLNSSNDLTLVGTQAHANNDLTLNAGNDLTIRAASNDSNSDSSRHSGGAEAGITVGRDGLGVYGSVNIGRGQLDREGVQQQEAYLYGGGKVSFTSGRDTTVAGATIRGQDVAGDVGRNLSVSSLPDTGKANGREYDASLTVTVGYGASVSGSVGYGETNGQTNWVNRQTGITAADSLNIRTGNHTQLDGAVLASDNGNLKLDTGSLGFRDIAGEDREHGYYLNVGGTYGLSNGASGSSSAQQDPSRVGKENSGSNGWSVEGYDYQKDREQIVRATVGAGEITVRQDAETGQDSTAGLNRDKDHSSEITKDESSRTDFYASDSSIKAVSQPTTTAKDWARQLTEYDKTAAQNFKEVGLVIGNQLDAFMHPGAGAEAIKAGGAEIAGQALSALLESGLPRDKARALLANEQFQSEVLDALKGISDYGKGGQLEKTRQGLAEAGIPEVVQLEDMNIEGRPATLAEVVLERSSQINAYIKAHPDQAETVGLVMAAAQGPKGLILLAVNSVISQTAYAEKVKEAVDVAGQYVAESMQKTDLDAKDEYGSYLIGGGTLIATTLLGIVSVKVVGAGKKILSRKESSGAAHNEIESNNGGAFPEQTFNFTQRQLDKKFKHASDFGVITTKKNPETLAQFESAIKAHMSDAATVQKGTYGFVKDSKVFFNSATNNVVVVDGAGNFVTGFKLAPGTQQFDNFMKNGILR